MATRLERVEASLKREQRRLDLRRLKKARDSMELASEFLKSPFLDREYEDYMGDVRTSIDNITHQLTNTIDIRK